MLKYLTIKNYAIVSDLEIEYHPGFSVITGETGAGKSITFDALNFVLGARADSQVVRHGAQRCDIIAEFDISKQESIHQWLEQHELADEGACIIKRHIHHDGRSRSFINDQPCALQTTRELANQLVHIHGQHENQNLLKRDGQRELLDAYAKHPQLVDAVQSAFSAYQQVQQQLKQLEEKQWQTDRQAFIEYQLQELKEIDGLDLAQIETQQTELAHAEKILANCDHVRHLLSDDDGVYEQLHRCTLALAACPNSSAIESAQQNLEQSLIHLREAESQLNDYAANIEVNPQQLQLVEAQLEKVYQLARKHRVKPAELIQTQVELTEELETLTQCESKIIELKAQAQQHLEAYHQHATKLSKSRHKAATQCAQAIVKIIHNLGMAQCEFEIQLTQCKEPKKQGYDTIDFMIRPNPGQAMQALNKIASGGELSRIALAIQVVTAGEVAVPTLLFDEVDVGISGATAAVIGKLMRDLSQHAQILCVTHQAQVASFGNQHYLVQKSSDGDITESEIKLLNEATRVAELARMLGGMEVTKQTLAHAKDLIAQAN